uniref:Disease resistance protein At3g14460 isoform X2 n=1 Tax=Cicer arietinum TaxID=3827 RepID=A0A3Q7Y6J1_CICAR|nr:putative disease resistance protein At3g14460 isoform X2 [Cicer arietinum]
MDKKYLEELSFEWSGNAKDQFTNSQSDMDILDKLQPAKNLKKVSICGYRGTRFPEWVGDPSYHNLTELYLSDCHNCCILPPLGQLRSLKKLRISRMSMLETIASEYGDSFSGIIFPSLERLQFDKMPCWEVWHHPHDSNAYFPVLKSLVIHRCPVLRGDLPSHLPALETIQISQCDQLASCLPSAHAIRKLAIRESNKVMLQELPLSLEDIEIQGREATESFFEVIAITLPISLKIVRIEIKNCSSAISFPGDCLPASLNSLSITDCRNLDFPKQKQQHESLQRLHIESSCDSLTTLPLETFPRLRSLNIWHCENLECISASKILQNLNEILITNCPKLVSFARDGLSAPNLRSLLVFDCVNLKSLTCHANTLLRNLEIVSIWNCPEMETFCEGGVPPSLRSLDIEKCEKLMRSPSLSLMDTLTHLKIGRCDGVESFPNKDCALLPPSLTSLTLCHMSSLHTLDCTELLHLTSLQHLAILFCYKLENMAGERLPATLTILQIIGCPLLEERCRMKHPQIWPKISHIQSIVFHCT